MLSKEAEKLSRHSKNYGKMREQLDRDIDKYSKAAVEAYPDEPTFQYNRGIYLANKKDLLSLKEGLSAFLKSIDADPRYVEPYQKLGQLFCDIRKNFPDDFPKVWEAFKTQIHGIVKKHSTLNGFIKNGLEKMQKAIPLKKPFRKEVVELIEKVK